MARSTCALVLAVDAGLLQQPVDQGGFAVVDVRDDGDVAKVHCGFQKPKRGPLFWEPATHADVRYCGAI